MKKKIALVELYAHSEVLYHFMQLYLSEHYPLAVFTNDFIYEDAYEQLKKSSQVEWFIRSEKESRSTFIAKNITALNGCDHVVFITLVSDFQFFAQLKLSVFSTLILHNAMTYLRPYRGIHLTLSKELGMDILRMLKFLIKREGYWKQRMLSNFDEICFPSRAIQRYVEAQGWTKNYRVGEVMPFAVHSKVKDFKNLSPLPHFTFTIPGTISENSRDYEMVYRVFKSILNETSQAIRLVLLGQPKGRYGMKVIRLFESLARVTFQVTHFKCSVPQLKFDDWMVQTDVLLLPLRQHLKLGIYREKYGYTNVSGGVNDAIKFNIKTLLPDFYPIEEVQENLFQPFENEVDLKHKILTLLSHSPCY